MSFRISEMSGETVQLMCDVASRRALAGTSRSLLCHGLIIAGEMPDAIRAIPVRHHEFSLWRAR